MARETNIRTIREAKGLTLRDVAQRLDTTAATISRWEREPQRVTVPVLKNLARVLDVDPAALLAELQSQRASNRGVVMVQRLNVENNTGEDNPFDADYISRLTKTPASQLAILTVASDAMAPFIQVGDQALIDLSVTTPEMSGIYALRLGSIAHLRRINVLLGSQLVRVSVDNPVYGGAEDLCPTELDVCGRVIWLGKKM